MGAHEENCRGVSRGLNDTVSDASAALPLDYWIFPSPTCFILLTLKKPKKKNCFMINLMLIVVRWGKMNII